MKMKSFKTCPTRMGRSMYIIKQIAEKAGWYPAEDDMTADQADEEASTGADDQYVDVV